MKGLLSKWQADQPTALAALMFSAFAITGCDPGQPGQSRYRAPLTKEQAEKEVAAFGLTPDQFQALNEKADGQCRRINVKHGGYACSGVSSADVRLLAPQAHVFQNSFISQQQVSANGSSKSLFSSLRDVQSSLPEFELRKGEKLDPCDFDTEVKPLLVLESAGEQINVAEDIQTILVGQKVELNALASQPNPEAPSDIKVGMLVKPPEGSNIQPTVTLDGQVNFMVDSVGIFEVLTVVQDDRNSCATKILRFAVTANDPYLGPKPLVDVPLMSLFHHLDQVDAKPSWELSTGEGVVVAVVDSGVNYNHSQLRNNVFINKNEIPNNGIDDDKNGYIDDYTGYDLFNEDAFPFDDYGHGSHIAGLIAAETFGMAKSAKLLPVKAGGAAGDLDSATLVGSILYAADMGADIVNMSFGSYSAINHYKFAIKHLEKKGVLAVAASGNGDPDTGFGVDTDDQPNFPSADESENLLSVAAKDSFNPLAPYSNYGKASVDLTAPGGLAPDDMIQSTFCKNAKNIQYSGQMGTSMATPIVAGVAAQVLAINPALSPVEVKSIILKSGKTIPGLIKYVSSGKTLNSYNAVKLALDSLVADGGKPLNSSF